MHTSGTIGVNLLSFFVTGTPKDNMENTYDVPGTDDVEVMVVGAVFEHASNRIPLVILFRSIYAPYSLCNQCRSK